MDILTDPKKTIPLAMLTTYIKEKFFPGETQPNPYNVAMGKRGDDVAAYLAQYGPYDPLRDPNKNPYTQAERDKFVADNIVEYRNLPNLAGGGRVGFDMGGGADDIFDQFEKRLLEYDDVMNLQREVIYTKRKNALDVNRLKVDIANMIYESVESIYISAKNNNDFKSFEFDLIRFFSITSPFSNYEFENLDQNRIIDDLYNVVLKHYKKKNHENSLKVFPVIKNVFENPKNKFERIVVPFTDGKKTMNIVTDLKKAYESEGKELINDFEKNISLAILDDTWKTHLRKMDELKQSVQLAVHEQKDPLLIYKFEAKELFFSMIDQLNKDILTFLFKGELPSKNPSEITEDRQTRRREKYNTSKAEILNSDEMANRNRKVGAGASRGNSVVETIVREQRKIGRNERVKIKNIQSGEVKQVKYKQAEPLIQTGTWILNET